MKIRKLNNEDLETRVNWMNNPKIYSTMPYSLPITIEGTREWFERVRKDCKRIDFCFETDNTICAMAGLTSIQKDAGKGELYLFVNPSLLTKGIGTIATNLLCRYAFEELELEKVFLYTDSDNYRAQRVYEKNNFKLQYILPDKVRRGDKMVDRYYYELLKRDFVPLINDKNDTR